MNTSKIDKTAEYATLKHRETNHKYDGLPYEIHLRSVYTFGLKYIELIPAGIQTEVLQACWTHDLIEDCRETYNDVYKECGEVVANITYALTNEKGKNRSERANDRYYQGIKDTPFAAFVKFCDRLANVTYSRDSGSDMFYKYRHENHEFIEKIYHPVYQPMVDELRALFTNKPS